MIRTSLFAAIAAAALFQPAVAAETVSYDRAALSNPAATAVLYAELEDASARACKEALRFSTFRQYQKDSCVRATLENAVAAIDLPELTAFAGTGAAERRLALAE